MIFEIYSNDQIRRIRRKDGAFYATVIQYNQRRSRNVATINRRFYGPEALYLVIATLNGVLHFVGSSGIPVYFFRIYAMFRVTFWNIGKGSHFVVMGRKVMVKKRANTSLLSSIKVRPRRQGDGTVPRFFLRLHRRTFCNSSRGTPTFTTYGRLQRRSANFRHFTGTSDVHGRSTLTKALWKGLN